MFITYCTNILADEKRNITGEFLKHVPFVSSDLEFLSVYKSLAHKNFIDLLKIVVDFHI